MAHDVAALRRGWFRRVRKSIISHEVPAFSDVTFICEGDDEIGGRSVHAIQGMLACHSEAFMDLFFSGERQWSEVIESSSERLTLKVPWRQRALSRMVEFCLTGNLCCTRADVLEQILLADHYALSDLLSALVTRITEEADDYSDLSLVPREGSAGGAKGGKAASKSTQLVDRENVLSALECACTTGDERLRDHCMRIILAPDFAPAVLTGEDASGGAALAAL